MDDDVKSLPERTRLKTMEDAAAIADKVAAEHEATAAQCEQGARQIALNMAKGARDVALRLRSSIK